MEKQLIEVEVVYPFNWEYGVEISQIRKDLDELEKLGATHIQIEHGVSWDCSYVNINAVTERLETDEEFNARVDEFNRKQERIKREELEQLEKLKAKYGQ